MVQNFVTKTDLLLPKTLNFLEDGNISTTTVVDLRHEIMTDPS